MESIEERIERIEYYQQLLLNMIGEHEFPVYELIIRSGLSKREVGDLFTLCEQLSKEYEEQMKSGLIHYHPLLTHFVGMLNVKLDPAKTVEAFYLQNMFKPLMKKLMELIKAHHY